MTTTAIILAAGFSRRMGAAKKLLMQVNGAPVLRSIVEAVLVVVDTAPLVVLGHDADAVARSLEGLPISRTINPAPERGQASSVRLGLEQAADADTTLLVLGDQPFLTEGALRRLLAAHVAEGRDRITVPMCDGVRGNPIVLPRLQRQAILASGQNLGCGAFTRQNPHMIHRFDTRDPAFFLDIDTPDDLDHVRVFAATEAAS